MGCLTAIMRKHVQGGVTCNRLGMGGPLGHCIHAMEAGTADDGVQLRGVNAGKITPVGGQEGVLQALRQQWGPARSCMSSHNLTLGRAPQRLPRPVQIAHGGACCPA